MTQKHSREEKLAALGRLSDSRHTAGEVPVGRQADK